MAEKYTEEDLKAMSRVELRRAAIEVLKVDNKEISNSKSEDLRARILEAQEGGAAKPKGGKIPPKAGGRGLPGTKGKVAPKPEPEPEVEDETPEETPEEEAPAPKGKPAGKPAAGPGTVVDAKKYFDAIGKAVDEVGSGQQEMQETLVTQLNEIERKQFIMLGLLTDIFKAVNEPDELEPRLTELQEEWEKECEGGNE